MQYVRLAVPQELYKSLGFCPEMALLPSSDMKSIKIVPLSSISKLPSSSDSSVSRINLYENSGSLEPLQSNSLSPFTEKSDNIVEKASTLPSDLDSNNQTDLCNKTLVEVDTTPAIDVEKGNKNGDAPHKNVGIDSCQNLSSEDQYQMIEGDSVEESNISFGYREERESPQGKILESKETVYETVNIPISIKDQGCASNDNDLDDGLFDNNLSSERIGKSDSFKDLVSSEESSMDGNRNDSPERLDDESDPDCASEDHLSPPQNSEKVMNDQLQSNCKIISSSKKTKLNVEPQSNKIPFIKVCDNCCRTYKAKKTFQRHKKNCERFKAELVSGKVRKERGSVKISENDIISDVRLKGPKTINHLIWKKGPRVDITCEKCHWKFFSLNRYERHLTYCKTLQTRGADILDNSIEKDKSVKWIHAPTESTKKAQQYFVLRK